MAAMAFPGIIGDERKIEGAVRLGGMGLKVVSAIKSRRGMTSEQVERAIGEPHQSVSACINGLTKRGILRQSGETRKTRRNRSAAVYEITWAYEDADFLAGDVCEGQEPLGFATDDPLRDPLREQVESAIISGIRNADDIGDIARDIIALVRGAAG